MKRSIVLISNMYPNIEFPSYGIFVKTISDDLDIDFSIHKIVMNKKITIIDKLFGYMFFYLKQFVYFLRNNPDNVYCHFLSHTIFIPVLFKVLGRKYKLIVHIHGSDVHFRSSILQKIIKRLIRFADTIVVPSECYKNIVKGQFNILARKILVSPSGGVSQEFTSNHSVRIDMKAFEYDLAFVGRLSSEKNPLAFISLVNQLNIKKHLKRVIVIGSGPMEGKVTEAISNLELDIDLLPSVKKNNLPDYFDSIKYLLITSSRESLCLVALEAMARGVVVISTKCGGPESYIRHGINGFLFDTQDVCHVDLISQYTSISDLEYRELSRNARETALKYCSKTVLNDMKSLFD